MKFCISEENNPLLLIGTFLSNIIHAHEAIYKTIFMTILSSELRTYYPSYISQTITLTHYLLYTNTTLRFIFHITVLIKTL